MNRLERTMARAAWLCAFVAAAAFLYQAPTLAAPYPIGPPDIDSIEPNNCGKNTLTATTKGERIETVCLMITPRFKLYEEPINILYVEKESGEQKVYFYHDTSDDPEASKRYDAYVLRSSVIDASDGMVKKSHLYRVFNHRGHITQMRLKFFIGRTPEGLPFHVENK